MSAAQIEDLFMAATMEAVVSLFSSYHVSVDPIALEDSGHSPASRTSRIGFVGDHIHGTLILGTTREPLTQSMPIRARDSDWIAELSNQLLGRIKNQVIRRGIEFSMSTPSTVSRRHLRKIISARDFRPWTFTTPGGVVCLWVELVVAGPIWPKIEPIDSDVAAEGDVLLF